MRRATIAATIIIALIVLSQVWNTGRTRTTTPVPGQRWSTPAQPSMSPRPSSDPPGSSVPTGSPSSNVDRAEPGWEPVIEGFALAYTATDNISQREWLENLQPYCAAALFNDLTHTQLHRVPDGRYAGFTVLRRGEETLTVRVVYQQGWALVLYVRAVATNRYVIDRFDRTEDFD